MTLKVYKFLSLFQGLLLLLALPGHAGELRFFRCAKYLLGPHPTSPIVLQVRTLRSLSDLTQFRESRRDKLQRNFAHGELRITESANAWNQERLAGRIGEILNEAPLMMGSANTQPDLIARTLEGRGRIDEELRRRALLAQELHDHREPYARPTLAELGGWKSLPEYWLRTLCSQCWSTPSEDILEDKLEHLAPGQFLYSAFDESVPLKLVRKQYARLWPYAADGEAYHRAVTHPTLSLGTTVELGQMQVDELLTTNPRNGEPRLITVIRFRERPQESRIELWDGDDYSRTDLQGNLF